ncbi:MAG: response regulator [Mariprofundaceae bacterium]|nr:response regulator [Mariprofundaceae bacterium]
MEILVIDDEVMIEKIITAFLERYAKENHLSVNTHCISDPVEALYELTTHGERFDLVTLDVRMPKLVGDLIFETLMDAYPQLLDKILFVTGHRDDLQWRFPDLDLNVLVKPFNYAQFRKAIDSMMGNHITQDGKQEV